MSNAWRHFLAVFATLGLVVGGTPAFAHEDDAVRIHGVAVGTQKLHALPGGALAGR